MDHTYAGTAYPYKSSGLNDHFQKLGDMHSARRMYA